VNLVEWVISIAIMLRIVGSTLPLVGSERRSIMAAKIRSQSVGDCNSLLKVVLCLWNGELKRRDYATDRPNDEFVAAIEEW